MRRILVKNGTLYLEDGAYVADLLVEDGRIAGIGKFDYSIDDCCIVEAVGLHVLPGLIDIHTHLDDVIGGYELADTWSTGSEIAIVNGITTLCGFITQRQGRPFPEQVGEALGKAEGRSFCDYAFHLTPTRFGKNDWVYIEKMMSDGFRTFKFYTTYRRAGIFTEYETLQGLMTRIKDMGASVLVHCEDDDVLSRAMSAIADRTSAHGHALSRPPEAEVLGFKNVLEISRKTKCPTHIVHVSTSEGASVIRRVGQDLAVSCETCPQYLFLDEERLKGANGHRFICSPPLRSAKNAEEMRRLALDGAFDVFATDHCAFSKREKDDQNGDFAKVPNGLPGIGALVPLAHQLLNDFGIMAKRLAMNPAKVAGLYPRKGTLRKGSDADLAVFSEEVGESPVRSSLADVHEPYYGMTSKLRAKHVILRGEFVVKYGEKVEGEINHGKRA